MSKAFVPEDTAAPAAPLGPIRPDKPQPITPGGRRRLSEERVRLAGGDEADRARLPALDRILATVEVVAPALFGDGAGFGCQVEVEDEGGARRTFVLCGPDEVDAKAGRITAGSPVGRALLGRRAGDAVELPRAGGIALATVVAVRIPSE